MRNQNGRERPARRLAAVLGLGLALGAAGCDDFMKVTNPGAIENPALEHDAYLDLMVQGVIGDFHPTYAWTALFSGVFADELRNHHSFFENGEIDRREVNENNGTYVAAVYNGLHRTRFLADSVATRIQTLRGDSAGMDLRLAKTYAYGGYTWMLMGEQFCATPINRSDPVPSQQLLATALQRFEKAVAVATAARAAATSQPNAAVRNRMIAGADSILNFARVGAARSALGLSAFDATARQKALEHARAVAPAYASPAAPGFAFRAHYALDGGRYTRRVSNPFWEFIPDGRWFSISGTRFDNLGDPRVPMRPDTVAAADGTRRTFPNSPASFSSNNGTLDGALFDREASIRIASALEARYIVAELEGVSPANLAFVNERRAMAGQAPLTATGAADYQAALREQRARDFYLDGHRMGDLRRYKQALNLDLWPRGSYYGSATLSFGAQECWPIPLSEQY